jgi:hypothetical protein
LYRQFGLTALGRKRRTDTGQHREMSPNWLVYRIVDALPADLPGEPTTGEV